MAKARIKVQLFECCWAGEAFSLVRISFSKTIKGRERRNFMKTIS